MENNYFTITFLNENFRICEEKDATFVDIVERSKKTGQIIKQVIGTVNKEAIKIKSGAPVRCILDS